jgi:hypothetical protein
VVTKIVDSIITAEILEHRSETRQGDLHDQFEPFFDRFRSISGDFEYFDLTSSQRYDNALSRPQKISSGEL